MSGLAFVHLGFGDAAVPYEQAWAEQRAVHQARVADQVSDTVLLLEHRPVYTAGKRTQPWERPIDGTPVIDVDRGGKITWHGPGQLVGYPIIKLPAPVDVVAYVRRLGVTVGRVAGRSGVWVKDSDGGPDRKVGAIGIRVSRGVTMHGFALNCDCDLAWFDRIIPCGIADAGVTSLTAELGRRVSVNDVLPVVQRELTAALDGTTHVVPVSASG